MIPTPGDLLHITRAASVQFVEPFFFRVIRVHDWITYDGWLWLDGYELNSRGIAVRRRSIFVMRAGLRSIRQAGPGVRPMPSPNRGRWGIVRPTPGGNRR